MASGTVGLHNRRVGFGFTVPDDDDFAVMVHDEAIRMFGRSRFDSGAGVHFQYLLVNHRRLAGDLRLHQSSEPDNRPQRSRS